MDKNNNAILTRIRVYALCETMLWCKTSSQKQSIVYDLANTIPSAVLLGFGIVFLFLSVGLYV
jgi:hypothetical protein